MMHIGALNIFHPYIGNIMNHIQLDILLNHLLALINQKNIIIGINLCIIVLLKILI